MNFDQARSKMDIFYDMFMNNHKNWYEHLTLKLTKLTSMSKRKRRAGRAIGVVMVGNTAIMGGRKKKFFFIN